MASDTFFSSLETKELTLTPSLALNIKLKGGQVSHLYWQRGPSTKQSKTQYPG